MRRKHPLSGHPLAQVARTLHYAIGKTEDPGGLTVLNKVTADLQPLLDEHLINGIGRELNTWVGLKLDAPDMGATYGDDTHITYPEIFEGYSKTSGGNYFRD